MKRVPSIKLHSNPRAGTGSASAFDDAKIKGVKVVDTADPKYLREGFTKKLYTVPCGKGNFPKK